MGYYTDYTVVIDCEPELKEKFSKFIDEMKNENLGFKYLTEYAEGEWSGNLKWYEWENEIKFLSFMFPTIVFYIEGFGEDRDDIWKARCKNGELQIVNAHIVYDDFPYWEEEWSEIYEDKK